MIRSSQIAVDVEKTIGSPPFWLASVSEEWEYKDNKRTGNQLGYKYVIALPQLAFEKVPIKIPGKRQVDLQEGEICEVSFTGLELRVYVQNGGGLALTGKADSISLVANNDKKG